MFDSESKHSLSYVVLSVCRGNFKIMISREKVLGGLERPLCSARSTSPTEGSGSLGAASWLQGPTDLFRRWTDPKADG